MTVERRPYRSSRISRRVTPGAGVERLQPPIVEDEQVGAAEVAEDARMTPIATRQGKFFEELGHAVVEH